MPDFFRVTLNIRHVIAAIIATAIFTVGIVQFIKADSIPVQEWQATKQAIEKNKSDIFDVQLLLKEQQVMQKALAKQTERLQNRVDSSNCSYHNKHTDTP